MFNQTLYLKLILYHMDYITYINALPLLQLQIGSIPIGGYQWISAPGNGPAGINIQ